MWLFPQIICEPFTVLLSRPVTDDNEKSYKEDCELPTYFKVASYLLDTNVADEIIAEAEAEVTNFKQPTKIMAGGYSEIRLENTL